MAVVVSAIIADDLEAVAIPPEVAVHVTCLGSPVWYVMCCMWWCMHNVYSRLYSIGRSRMGPVRSWCIVAPHAPLCYTCGVDCEQSCNVDVVPVAGICDTGGCRRSCTASCSTAAVVAAEVVHSIH